LERLIAFVEITMKDFLLFTCCAMFALLVLCLNGCETNHPQEAPELTEVSATDLANGQAGNLDGWWIEVCPKKTDADSFRLSVGPDDHDITQKIIWRRGDPLEFQLLHGTDLNEIYVVGYSDQDGKTAYFGVCHNSQICNRHFQPNQTTTTGGEGHLVRSGDTEAWNCE
jgi:hypothetical protein